MCGNGFSFTGSQIVSNVLTTNFFGLFSTNGGATNLFTNAVGQTFLIQDVTYFTNYTYVVHPVECIGSTNNVALREGIDKITFVRQDFDSLLGGSWAGATNFYTLTAVTNGAVQTQYFKRVTTVPDIVFSAADQASGPGGVIVVNVMTRTTPNFNTTQALPGLAGPGTIQSPISIVFDKVGPSFVSSDNFFLSGGVAFNTSSTFGNEFVWGSFDGSTNAPIVYPDGTSLSGLLSQIFFQVTNNAPLFASISTNTAAHPFTLQLGATGGSPPYIWSLSTNSPALPPGFALSTGGLLSGVPTTPGVYDFIVQATDAGLRAASADLTIQIVP